MVQGFSSISASVKKSYKIYYVSPDATIGSGAVTAHISNLAVSQSDVVLWKYLTNLEI